MNIDRTSSLWQYLSATQRVLADDGAFLWEDSERHRNEEPTDYSYIVFPFAKLFEGFLKQAFLDLGVIRKKDYFSDKFRIGKVISPTLVPRLGDRSAYKVLAKRYGTDLADEVFMTWKEGRNLVFHYFPHNYRSLTRQQAGTCITMIITTMHHIVERTKLRTYVSTRNDEYVLIAKSG